jgi:hypothetical protein
MVGQPVGFFVNCCKILIALIDPDALALFCSRGSPTSSFLSLENWPGAAMCVQPNAVSCNATQYIVLYCLTPAGFRRYSSFNLCPPCPAWGEKCCLRKKAGIDSSAEESVW